MTEQQYTQKVNNSDTTLYPAEGRVDVAADVEEEQRNAYSAHPKMTPPQGSRAARQGSNQDTHAPLADPGPVEPPAEGRVDVAADVEEEQRNAYSAHHH